MLYIIHSISQRSPWYHILTIYPKICHQGPDLWPRLYGLVIDLVHIFSLLQMEDPCQLKIPSFRFLLCSVFGCGFFFTLLLHIWGWSSACTWAVTEAQQSSDNSLNCKNKITCLRHNNYNYYDSSSYFGGKKSEFSACNTFYHLHLDDSAVCQWVVGKDLTINRCPVLSLTYPWRQDFSTGLQVIPAINDPWAQPWIEGILLERAFFTWDA